jgi:hypothetical protein
MKFASKVFQCAAMILLAATAAFSQTPTSGVLLTIYDSNNNLVSAIWDSQIHTGTVLTSPCDSSAFNRTDAYVFQGGSWIGCDNGDPFETTQPMGTKTVGNFTFQTNYPLVSSDSPVRCNSNGNICIGGGNASVDTGFLKVTYNGNGGDDSTPFTGTIALSGSPNITGNGWCPSSPGLATDTHTFIGDGALAVGGSWTFALAIDSSNCGGWNADLTLPITAGQPTTFRFGPDSLQVTPANSAAGDKINFSPKPVPYADFNGSGGNLLTSGLGNGQACISYASFSPEGTGAFGVCPEFQTSCINPSLNNNDGPPPACLDGETFFWTGSLNFTIDQVSLPSGVGFENFLGQPGASCPQTTFSVNDLISFTGALPGLDPPLKPGGSGLNCFVTTYTFNSNPIISGTFSAFDGPLAPFAWHPNGFNNTDPGVPVPIFFKYNNFLAGAPVTNLHWCPFLNSASSTGCGFTKFPTPKPWFTTSRIPVSAPGCAASNINTNAPVIGLFINYSLVPPFLRPKFVTPTEYQFLWLTSPNDTGCTTLVFQFSDGPTVQPASFDFVED